MKLRMKRYTFKYGHWARATVTVHAKNEGSARRKARDMMDKRYERLGKEPPVAWTLDLIGIIPESIVLNQFYGVK
jgi:hypothetical protein